MSLEQYNLIRPGKLEQRLQLIWDVYRQISSSTASSFSFGGGNGARELPLAWDFAQIAAAIAGGYTIELSPHYKGVQAIRKNPALWAKVSKYVDLRKGQGCLPYDEGSLGERWQVMNRLSAHDLADDEVRRQRRKRSKKTEH